MATVNWNLFYFVLNDDRHIKQIREMKKPDGYSGTKTCLIQTNVSEGLKVQRKTYCVILYEKDVDFEIAKP